MPAARVTVVGIGADGWGGLSSTVQRLVDTSDVLVGSERQLALVPHGAGGERRRLPSPLLPALPDLIAGLAGRIVVLASGDPMFHGIGSTLVRLLGSEHVEVVPHPSSVSLAAARMGWALDDVDVVSLVARPVSVLVPALQPGRRVLVLVTEPTAAGEIRSLLASHGLAPSAVTVLSDLGGSEERVQTVGDDSPHGRLAIVAVQCAADAGHLPLPRTPGLPEEAFEQDGQITKHEIRAIALAALAPMPGQLLWDVGAGSGSIGIEWMRTHPASRALAIEPRADRRERIARNADALGVPGITVVAGSAPGVLAGLPTPDAVFVGGGVTADGVISACWEALGDGGRLVANAVTIEGEQALVDWQRRLGGSLTRISVERADPLGSFTCWRPALPVVQWSVRKHNTTPRENA